MNISLNGVVEKKLNKMIKKGYANTKSEAIRLSVLSFDDSKDFILSEEELVDKKLNKIDEDIEKGNTNLLNDKQALGKYSKYLKGKNVKD